MVGKEHRSQKYKGKINEAYTQRQAKFRKETLVHVVAMLLTLVYKNINSL